MSREARLGEGWSILILLLGMVVTSSLALVATDWTVELEIVPLVGAAGLLAGLLLSVSRFGGTSSHLLSAIYGTTLIGFLVGRGLPGEMTWRERILELVTRLSDWVEQAVYGGTSQDALIFLLFWSALFWALAYTAAWNTYRRRRPWLTALSFAIVCIVAAHFYVGDAPLVRYLVLYLLVAILYVGRAQTFKEQDHWRQEHVAYDPKLGMDVLRSSLVVALLALALAWSLPSTSSASTSAAELWERVNTPWETIEEEWQRLFSSIHSGEIAIDEPFGSSLALGIPSNLGDALVLDISAPRQGRYYWRGATYATYDGARWHLPGDETVRLAAGERALAVLGQSSRNDVVQEVTNYLPGRHLLFGAAQVAAVDREVEALARVEDERVLAIDRLSNTEPLGAGEQYTVTSRISQADGASLRHADSGYPDWVIERYLQLPSSLPERVGTLAERITVGAENRYDKARLLEQYLRETIEYDLSPPAVPPGRDYVDFLLFDSQRGYCNGYATAMVIMARSLDMPARVATGYAQGTYDPEREVFRVREENAHAWPEIYFPGFGWIEFEPTVSQDPLIRPEPVEEAAPEPTPPPTPDRSLTEDLSLTDDERPQMLEDDGLVLSEEDQPAERSPIWPWVAAVLVPLAVIAAGWWSVENLGLRRLPNSERAYARLLRFGRWLGRPLRAPDTPLEWARDLGVLVPEAEEPISHIAGIYMKAQFGRGDARDPAANTSWRRARRLLWHQLLWGQWLGRLRLALSEAETKR